MKRNRLSAIFALSNKVEAIHLKANQAGQSQEAQDQEAQSQEASQDAAETAFVACPQALLHTMSAEQQKAFQHLYQLAYRMAQAQVAEEINRFQRLLEGVDIRDSEFENPFENLRD